MQSCNRHIHITAITPSEQQIKQWMKKRPKTKHAKPWRAHWSKTDSSKKRKKREHKSLHLRKFSQNMKFQPVRLKSPNSEPNQALCPNKIEIFWEGCSYKIDNYGKFGQDDEPKLTTMKTIILQSPLQQRFSFLLHVKKIDLHRLVIKLSGHRHIHKHSYAPGTDLQRICQVFDHFKNKWVPGNLTKI